MKRKLVCLAICILALCTVISASAESGERPLAEPVLSYTPSGSTSQVTLTEWNAETDTDTTGAYYTASYGYKIKIYDTLNSLTSLMQNPGRKHFDIVMDMRVNDQTAQTLSGKFVIPQESIGNRSTVIARIVSDSGEVLYDSGTLTTQDLSQSFEIPLAGCKQLSFQMEVEHIGDAFFFALTDIMTGASATAAQTPAEESEEGATTEYDVFLIYLGTLSEPNDAWLYVSSWDADNDVDTLNQKYGPGGLKVGATTILSSLTQSMQGPLQENVIVRVALAFDPQKDVNTLSGKLVISKDSLNNRSQAIVSIVSEDEEELYASPILNSQSLPESFSVDVEGMRKVTFVFKYQQIGDPFYIGVVDFARN